MRIAQTAKTLVNALSILFPLAFAVGLISSFCDVLANDYVAYDMYRLIILNCQRSVNYWMTAVVSLFAVLILVSFVLVRMGKRPLSRLIEVRIKDGPLLLRKAALMIFSLFTLYAAWAINHHWLPVKFHPVSLLVDVLILGVAIFLGRVLFITKWERLFGAGMFKHTKRIAFSTVVLLVLLNLCVFVDARMHTPNRPNIIFIVIDTLRADHLGCYGYGRATSPNIDDLASKSVFFENAISAAPWTTPSIAGMFTSQYPAVMGFTDEPVRVGKGFVTLAELLRQNNYKTKGIISHTFLSSALGFDQGFDSYDEDNSLGHGHISSPSLTEKAVAWLRQNKNDPFFLFVHYFDPHFDFILHEEFDYCPDYKGSLYSSQSIIELQENAPYMNDDDVRYLKALYDSEIRFTDQHIGVLMDELEELDLFDNTLIVFTADHGEEFLERGDYWIGHVKKLYQEQIHVPLMIKLPDSTEKKVIGEYVGLIDLMPTIADIADLTIPEKYEYDGRRVVVDGEESVESRPVISETMRRATLQSVIWKGWKFIVNPTMNLIELYNIEEDPLETENAASMNPELLNEFNAMLQEWNAYTKSKRSDIGTQEPDFTEEQIKRLKSLGYL